MATVKDTLRYCLLKHPAIFNNALDVYNHLFCTLGNGFSWTVNGELVQTGGYDENNINDFTVKDSVINIIDEHIKNNNFLKEVISKPSLFSMNNAADILDNELNTAIIYIKNVFDVENKMNDFSIPVDKIMLKIFPTYKFKFSELSKHSKLYKIPDNVTDDWLKAAKKMVDLMEQHKDIVQFEDDIFDKVKERVNHIYECRFK